MALKKRFSKGMDGKICLHWLNVQLITDDADKSQWNNTLCGSMDDNKNQLHVVSAISHDLTPFFFRQLPTTRAKKGKPREIEFAQRKRREKPPTKRPITWAPLLLTTSQQQKPRR
jgi:hypothetical protein